MSTTPRFQPPSPEMNSAMLVALPAGEYTATSPNGP